MQLTHKALWTIERNLGEPLTLAAIAESCGVSRYHLAHAFGASTGLSVMQYVRARRLTEAARALAAGTSSILDLALTAGYGSHEAFSRAFRAQFHTTPEAVRRTKKMTELAMVKPMKLPKPATTLVEAPRIVAGAPMLLVGLSGSHSFGDASAIPGQWQKFMAAAWQIPDRLPSIPLGVTTNLSEDGNFDYVCAIEVSKVSKLLPGLIKLNIPAQTYAVVAHGGHVATLGDTYASIFNDWLPASRWRPADGPSLERHLETFDPQTGLGGVEIWISVEAKHPT